jgi:hypothetical protein
MNKLSKIRRKVNGSKSKRSRSRRSKSRSRRKVRISKSKRSRRSKVRISKSKRSKSKRSRRSKVRRSKVRRSRRSKVRRSRRSKVRRSKSKRSKSKRSRRSKVRRSKIRRSKVRRSRRSKVRRSRRSKVRRSRRNKSKRSKIRRSKSKRKRSRRIRSRTKKSIIKSLLKHKDNTLHTSLSLSSSTDKLDYDNIYLNTLDRVNIIHKLNNILKDVTKIYGKQCIHGDKAELLEKIQINKLLGTGTFGNVYSACAPKPCDDNSYKFAVKLSSFINKRHYKNPFNPEEQSWHEFFILKDYINPLVERGICPNLPLLQEGYLCNTCEFADNSIKECIITITELANGDMNKWFTEKNRTNEEIYSALFQIMAAIHTIQYHCQLINKDVKAPNILYYNVKPGGYWHYIIHGRDFYVPNYGHMFVLNDFGVSIVQDPTTKLLTSKKNTWQGTSRNFMILNNEISPLNSKIFWSNDKQSMPIKSLPLISWCNYKYVDNLPEIEDSIEVSKICRSLINVKSHKIKDCEIQFTNEQKEYLKSLRIPSDSNDIEFYMNPEIIPPFEFCVDTQDCIRTFVGGRRVSIPGGTAFHHKYNIPIESENKIKKYVNKYINGIYASSIQMLNPTFYVAGYFITDFFTKEKDYTKLPTESFIIDTYKIS